jgi:hypothetical protein
MRRSYSLFFLLLSGFSAFAQIKKKGSGEVANISYKNRLFTYVPHGDYAWTFGISSAFKADFALGFEKKLTELASAQVSMGLTAYDLMFDEGTWLNFRPAIMPKQSGSRYKPGISLKVGGKWYPFSEAESIKGFYAGPEFSYRMYKSEGYVYSKTNPGEFATYPQKNVQNELKLLVGWQIVDDDDFFHWDLGFGGGFRFHTRSYIGYSDPQTAENPERFKARKGYFIYNITIKTGISFSMITG